MKLEFMKELLALQTYGNFSLTAEKLFLSQPSLSRHIAAMEKELGVILLKRNTHKVEFTEDGIEACKTFQQMLNLYDGMCSDFSMKKAGVVGKLRLGTLYYTLYDDLGDIALRFWREYPKVELVQYSWQPWEVFSALLENRIDIGILPKTKFGAGKGLVFQDFTVTHGVAMMPVSHPLASKSSVTLDELREENLILLQDDMCLTAAILEAMEQAGFYPQKTIMTAHTDTVPFEILEGKGIYVTAAYSYPGFENKIRSIEISDASLKFHKSFAWHRDNNNPLIQCFLNLL